MNITSNTSKYKVALSSMIVLLSIILLSCNSDNKPVTTSDCTVSFNILKKNDHKINFKNKIIETEALNLFTYPYIYTSGGVAVGDLNGDNLPDLIFTGALVGDQIYRNLGNMEFENVTKESGLIDIGNWSTGITMLDINNDNLLDFYISKGGPFQNGRRKNELYINKGKFKFEESAKRYSIDDDGYSNQLYPIDIDNDNQLEYYLLNQPIDFQNNSKIRSFQNGSYPNSVRDKLFKLKGTQYTDESRKFGINNRAYGLSATTGDFNQDGFQDIYVCNDYIEPDFYYHNKAGKLFIEESEHSFPHITFNSMGSDAFDINNDDLLDLISLDMLPSSHYRSKTTMKSMNTDQFYAMTDNGYKYQYMSNVLQLNMGNGKFSDIGQLSGINSTDWSWSILGFDFDNNGYKDIFITNGIKRALTHNDSKIQIKDHYKSGSPMSAKEAASIFPEYKESNVFLVNQGNLKFSKLTKKCNPEFPVNSTGAAYADLDLDGDIDIITNNSDSEILIYENKSPKSNYLNIKLIGKSGNTLGIGTKLWLKSKSTSQFIQHSITRGYSSSVDPLVHFGLGNDQIVDSLICLFPNGDLIIQTKIYPNKTIALDQNTINENKSKWVADLATPMLKDVSAQLGIFINQKENHFRDFDNEVLIPHKFSQQGPIIMVGDITGDQREDFYIGGAKGFAGQLWTQNSNSTFSQLSQPVFEKDKDFEDISSVFFDLDNDGDLDLYVVSGGNEQSSSNMYADRLYMNNGTGIFNRSTKNINIVNTSGSKVLAFDVDGDNYKDIIVSGKAIPGEYPKHEKTMILRNINGKLKDYTNQWCPSCDSLGIINDMEIADIDNDGNIDLILAGEWTPIHILSFINGQFISTNSTRGTNKIRGWWSKLNLADIDQDGDLDILAGNIGENNKFKPSLDKPMYCYANDMDENGTLDIVLSKFSKKDGKYVPVRGKECSTQQMPFVSNKFKTYESYALAEIEDVYGEKLHSGKTLEANTFSSMLLINDGGQFIYSKLPIQTQFSEVNSIIQEDINNDGKNDNILAGNKYGAEVETVRYDASYGNILSWNKTKNDWVVYEPKQTGLYLDGNIKSLAIISIANEKHLLVGANQAKVKCYKLIDVKL